MTEGVVCKAGDERIIKGKKNEQKAMEKGILTREKNAKNNLFPAKSGVRKKCVRKVLIKNEEPSLF